MPSFLLKFFPSVLKKAAATKPNIYCVYDSQILTTFTSSLYIAGMFATLVASRLVKTLGRRNVMLLGGSTFLVGSALNGGAVNVAMLILGRMMLGFGLGFTNQVSLTTKPLAIYVQSVIIGFGLGLPLVYMHVVHKILVNN